MGKPFTQKDSGVFVQFTPGKQTYYLGDCVDLDSIPNPRIGGREFIQCHNRNRTGFNTLGDKITPPGGIEFTISELTNSAASWLEKVDCPFSLYALQMCSGERGVFRNWDRAIITRKTLLLDDPFTNVAHHVDDNELMHEFNVSAYPGRIDVHRFTPTRRTTSEVNALNAVAFCGIQNCEEDCAAPSEACETLVAVADAAVGATANVLASTDGGVTWAATAADPFAINEDILAVTCVEIRKGVSRWIVAREFDAAAAGEIAYSDDAGATWTLVVYGVTVGEGPTGGNALFALDSEHIWLATNQGDVFFSSDAGETWTTQDAITPSGGNALNAVHFADEDNGFAVGDADTVIRTIDGGAHWEAATATGTGDDLLSLHVFSGYRLQVGTDNSVGNTPLMISYDGGDTWDTRSFTGYATETVAAIRYANDYLGYLVSNTAGPVGSIHRTIDGGWSWEELTTPTNSGINHLDLCGPEEVAFVGEPNGGTALIVHAGI